MNDSLELVWILHHSWRDGFIGGHHATFRDACLAAESHNKDQTRSEYLYPKPMVILADARVVPIEALAACPNEVVTHSIRIKSLQAEQADEVVGFQETVKKILEGECGG